MRKIFKIGKAITPAILWKNGYVIIPTDDILTAKKLPIDLIKEEGVDDETLRRFLYALTLPEAKATHIAVYRKQRASIANMFFHMFYSGQIDDSVHTYERVAAAVNDYNKHRGVTKLPKLKPLNVKRAARWFGKEWQPAEPVDLPTEIEHIAV